jgi:hypothetical protein
VPGNCRCTPAHRIMAMPGRRASRHGCPLALWTATRWSSTSSASGFGLRAGEHRPRRSVTVGDRSARHRPGRVPLGSSISTVRWSITPRNDAAVDLDEPWPGHGSVVATPRVHRARLDGETPGTAANAPPLWRTRAVGVAPGEPVTGLTWRVPVICYCGWVRWCVACRSRAARLGAR